MLSEERIKELWGMYSGETYTAFERTARAIEAECAKVPEGWVVVPRIITPAIEAVYSNDSGAYGTAQELHEAMLAAAPKKAQAEKQEPVARVDANDDGYWAEILPDRSVKVGQLLYTRPQPDLTAEVERLKLSAEHWNRLYREKCQEFHDAQANKGHEIVWLIDRIAALEEAARQAREALNDWHNYVARSEAIAKLDAVLGN